MSITSDFDERQNPTAARLAEKLSNYPVTDMGGGLKIVSLPASYITAPERDLIVKALQSLTCR